MRALYTRRSWENQPHIREEGVLNLVRWRCTVDIHKLTRLEIHLFLPGKETWDLMMQSKCQTLQGLKSRKTAGE